MTDTNQKPKSILETFGHAAVNFTVALGMLPVIALMTWSDAQDEKTPPAQPEEPKP